MKAEERVAISTFRTYVHTWNYEDLYLNVSGISNQAISGYKTGVQYYFSTFERVTRWPPLDSITLNMTKEDSHSAACLKAGDDPR